VKRSPTATPINYFSDRPLCGGILTQRDPKSYELQDSARRRRGRTAPRVR
jgi:hypothetical protein